MIQHLQTSGVGCGGAIRCVDDARGECNVDLRASSGGASGLTSNIQCYGAASSVVTHHIAVYPDPLFHFCEGTPADVYCFGNALGIDRRGAHSNEW
jgi:hypothetical protein